MPEARSAATLQVHDHPCLIYDSGADLARAVVPYLRAGLLLGERCVYFVDENPAAFILDAMAEGGFDLAPYLANGAFQVIATRDAHLAEGYFGEPKMLAYWERTVADAQAAGFGTVRAAVEMTWALSGCPGCDVLVPYEARLNTLTDAFPISVVCAYRRSKFPAELIKGVIHAHPLVMADGAVLANAHHVRPEHFVENDAGLDVQAMLDNLALIDRLRAREAELEAADQMKNQFLGILSHELRTPLNAIMGFGSILADRVVGPLNEDQARYTARILGGAEVLLALIDDLLEMSRIQAGKFSLSVHPFELVEVAIDVIETLRPLADHKGQALVLEHGPLPRIDGDPTRVRQVITNLVANAIKFTPPGGRIVARARVEGDALRCEVVDTGVGIAEDQRDRLFRPFSQLDMTTTRPAGGTGLGLAISKALVEAHGGAIGVESQPGRGSTFWFELPLVPRPEAARLPA